MTDLTNQTNLSDCNGCCPGADGQPGPQGIQGIQGVPGATGEQGLTGKAGPQGAFGPQGLPGNSGPVGPAGPAGPKGEAGLTGQIGLQGPAGLDGMRGPQGVIGPQGVPGVQGLQGLKGDCTACGISGISEFAEAYSQVSQQLKASAGPGLAGGIVLLEKVVVASPNIDASKCATKGEFKVNLAGWYDIAAGMTGTLNPIPAPLPVWTLSLFLNNIIVPGSTFSNVPLSPAQASNEITADTFVYLNIGDTLTLANTSDADVFLSAPTLGTFAQTNSAYLKILLLRAGLK